MRAAQAVVLAPVRLGPRRKPLAQARTTFHFSSGNIALFERIALEVEELLDAFPNDAFLGEESGNQPGTSGFRWIIDPIDGTRAFISGLPLWGTLIGLKHNGRPAYGLMHQPFIGERFYSDGGETSYVRGKERRVLRTRRCDSLADATLASTTPRLFTGDAQRA